MVLVKSYIAGKDIGNCIRLFKAGLFGITSKLWGGSRGCGSLDPPHSAFMSHDLLTPSMADTKLEQLTDALYYTRVCIAPFEELPCSSWRSHAYHQEWSFDSRFMIDRKHLTELPFVLHHRKIDISIVCLCTMTTFTPDFRIRKTLPCIRLLRNRQKLALTQTSPGSLPGRLKTLDWFENALVSGAL